MFSISDYLEPANIKLRASKDCVSQMYFKITAGRGEVPLGLWSSIFTLQKMYPDLDNDYSTRIPRRQIADIIRELDMILLGLRCFDSLVNDRYIVNSSDTTNKSTCKLVTGLMTMPG